MKKITKILLIIFYTPFTLYAFTKNMFAGILLLFSIFILLNKFNAFISKKSNLNLKFITQVIISLLLFIAALVIIPTDNNNYNNINFNNLERNSINNTNNSIETVSTSSNTQTYKVIRVVDGDTVKINFNGKEESARLIGIDTPESVHPDESKNTEFGKQASEFTKNYIENKDVTIEFDVQERDTYGRLLVYLYIDDKMFNKILLEEGYAQIATYPPNIKYIEDFTKIQEKARNNKKGLWSYTSTSSSTGASNNSSESTKKEVSSNTLQSSKNTSTTNTNTSKNTDTPKSNTSKSNTPTSSKQSSPQGSSSSSNVEYNGHSVFHTKAGKIYHYSAKCSGMKSPIETTLQNAKDKGLRACKKCVE